MEIFIYLNCLHATTKAVLGNTLYWVNNYVYKTLNIIKTIPLGMEFPLHMYQHCQAVQQPVSRGQPFYS